MAVRNTIVLIGDLAKWHDERRMKDGEAVKPGMIVSLDTNDLVVKHATAGGLWEGLVVKEDDFQGRTVDDAYANGDVVFMHRCQPGDMIQLILKAGENADISEFLSSVGDGTMKVAGGADTRLFKTAEALDLSGVGAVNSFIKAYRV